jgi:hypothetical protein
MVPSALVGKISLALKIATEFFAIFAANFALFRWYRSLGSGVYFIEIPISCQDTKSWRPKESILCTGVSSLMCIFQKGTVSHADKL